jgi:DNA-binding FadR family transcriptional regulator
MEQLRDLFVYAWEHFGDRPVEQVFDQHEAIVGAVERCDPEAARAAMASHIAFYGDILLARVQEHQAARRGDVGHLPGLRGNGAGQAMDRRPR